MLNQNLKLDVDYFKGKLQDLEKFKDEQLLKVSDLQRAVTDTSNANSELK